MAAVDWTKVKGAIKTIAPWIASTLGSSVPGLAVKALCGALGLADNATPENVTAALAGATPEQLLALKTAEQQHVETMQKLGYEHIEQLEATAAADRADARKLQILKGSVLVPSLAIIIVGSFVATVAATLLGYSHVESALAGSLIGYLSAKCEQVVSFYFGSSASSDRKTELLAKADAIKS